MTRQNTAMLQIQVVPMVCKNLLRTILCFQTFPAMYLRKILWADLLQDMGAGVELHG